MIDVLIPLLGTLAAGIAAATAAWASAVLFREAARRGRSTPPRPNPIDAWGLRGAADVAIVVFGPRLADLEHRLDGMLLAAGRPWSGMPGRDYLAAGLLAAGASALLGFGLGIMLGPTSAVVFALTLGGLALFAWWRKLSDLVELRRGRTWREFPFFLDSLVLTMQAGATLPRALQLYRVSNPHAELTLDIEDALGRLALGGSMQQAVTEMLERIVIEEIRLVFHTLLQAEEMGNNPLRVLRESAQDLRNRRWEMVEKAGQQLQSRLVVPTMFVMIAVLLLVLTPAVVNVMQSGLL